MINLVPARAAVLASEEQPISVRGDQGGWDDAWPSFSPKLRCASWPSGSGATRTASCARRAAADPLLGAWAEFDLGRLGA